MSPVPPPPPDNDRCEGTSIELVSGVVVEGSTLNATVDDVELSCYVDQTDGLVGVWYTVVGTGSEAAMTLCDVGGNHDGWGMAIFEGSCDNHFSFSCNEFDSIWWWESDCDHAT